MNHGGLSVSPHYHLLLLQLLCHLRHIKGKMQVIFKRDGHNASYKYLYKHKLTSLAEDPETSIQVFEKKAQEPSMKTM